MIEFAGNDFFADMKDNCSVPQVSKIMSYFTDSNSDFTGLDYVLTGTEFQRRVWMETARVSSGTVISYGELARRIGSAPRAVAQALRHNPLPIVIPCHRVVGVHGVGGFIGATKGKPVEIKLKLLAHEGVTL